MTLTAFEKQRYERQIQLKQIGIEGQLKLKNACVGISRVGGVGGTVAAYLARAGIGKLVLAHGGKLTADYLNRWQLAHQSDCNLPSIEAICDHLHAINPAVKLEAYDENINDDNALETFTTCDVISDGAPLFEERYAINQAAITLDKPLVSGAMYSLEGYVTTVLPHKTACLKCIYPEKPDYWKDRKVFPVIGPSASMVGTMMAMDVIKIITGMENTLAGKMWHFDLSNNQFNTFVLKPNPKCPLCGEN